MESNPVGLLAMMVWGLVDAGFEYILILIVETVDAPEGMCVRPLFEVVI